MNYTEGEWIHKEDGVIMAGDYQVACVYPKDREANAHLIAAAPDCYEALKMVRKVITDSDQWWIDCPDKGGFDTDIIDKAIAKAESVQ